MTKNPSFFDRGHDTTTVEPLVPHNDRKRGNSKRKLEDDDDIVETRSTKKRCAHHLTDVRSSMSPIPASLTTRKNLPSLLPPALTHHHADPTHFPS